MSSLYCSRCGYCDTPYTFIARAETFMEDQSFIGQMANMTFPLEDIGWYKV